MTEQKNVTVECKLIQADVPTVNGNVYSREVLEKMIEEAKPRIDRRMLFGRVGISKEFRIKMDEISHIVTDLKLDGDKLVADFEVLDTPRGKILEDMIASEADITLHPHFMADINRGQIEGVKLSSGDVCLTDDAFKEA